MNIKSDALGNMVYTDGRFEIVTGAASIGQNIRANVRTGKGTWYLNKLLGVDYIRGFQKGAGNFLRYAIKQAVLNTVGVNSFNSFEFKVENRHMTIDCEVDTASGTVNYSEVV